MRSLLIALSLFSVLCGADEKPAWLGFKDPTDSTVPRAVSRVAPAIFQIIYPGGPVEIMEVGNIELKSLPRSRPEWFKILQIGVCQHQKIKRCPIFSKPITGSAYLVKDQFTVATALHMVQPWIYYALAENPDLKVTEIQPPVLLADGEFKVVFNALDVTASLKISHYNSSEFTFAEAYPGSTPEKQLYFGVSDYVELKTNRPFNARPLEQGQIDDHREPLFTIGFPRTTQVFSMFGGFDSPGIESWVSTGKLKGEMDPSGLAFATNVSASAGSDGGPLLNYQGQVVGIMITGASRKVDGHLEIDTHFLSVDEKTLSKAWSRFAADGKHL